MYLRKLHLRQFRNYSEQPLDFVAPKTILVGNNAQGKSNLLEAVELLATLRSHRATRDRELVKTGEPLAQITATIDRAVSQVQATLTFRASGRRTVVLNSETLTRQMDFLGSLNAVQFSSLDLELVRGGPEQRRHWLDTLLMQLEPVYSHILHQYQQVLRQRNALLKRIQRHSQNHSSSEVDSRVELAIWDTQLAAIGCRVIRRRARAIDRLSPIAQEWHRAISGSTEQLDLGYAPNVGLVTNPDSIQESTQDPAKQAIRVIDDPNELQQAFHDKIQQRTIAEQQQGTSLVGPHRDEVEFTINQTPARQYGSQGQQRTLVLALKLAELKLIEEVVREPPLLLLDDVLAELDLNRQNQLLDAIQDRFQTIITTTHLGSFDAHWLKSSQILSVNAGRIEVF